MNYYPLNEKKLGWFINKETRVARMENHMGSRIGLSTTLPPHPTVSQLSITVMKMPKIVNFKGKKFYLAHRFRSLGLVTLGSHHGGSV